MTFISDQLITSSWPAREIFSLLKTEVWKSIDVVGVKEEGTEIILAATDDLALLFVGTWTWWQSSVFGVGEYHDDAVKLGLRTVDLVDEDNDGVEESKTLREKPVAAIVEC